MESVPAGNEATMLLAGMLSFQPVIRTTNITRTRYLDGINVRTIFAVPPFAASMSYWKTLANVGDSFTLEFLDRLGTVAYAATIAGSTIMSDPIPLAGDIVQVAVTPQAGKTFTFSRAIFNLEF
jgi:hypothetical protein